MGAEPDTEGADDRVIVWQESFHLKLRRNIRWLKMKDLKRFMHKAR